MTVVTIKLSRAVRRHLRGYIGYIITRNELKTESINIGHVVLLASVTVVDLLCTKYAVLMN